MSSYLLAFVIGHFKSAASKTSRGVDVRTISDPYLQSYLSTSAKIGADCIDAMEGLVKIDYPWGKLDNVEMLEMGHSSGLCLDWEMHRKGW